MHEWQILDEPDHDRIRIANVTMGVELYLPHWSTAQVETMHSPPESGIRAELLNCHTKDTWSYSLSHIENASEVCTPPYLLEVWIDYCLVITVQLPFALGEELRQRWLEKSDTHFKAITRDE